MRVARNIFLGREPKNRLGLSDFGRMHRDAADLLDGFGVRVDPRRPLHTLGIGKISNIYAGQGISENIDTEGNTDGVRVLLEQMEKRQAKGTLIFCNLIDFDMQ